MSLSTSMCILDYNSSHMHWEVPMLSCTMFTYKVFVLVIKVSYTPSYWILLSFFYFHVYVQNSYPYFSTDQTITLHSSSVPQAKSPRVNFTWNEFHMNFTWNFHVNFTWISRENSFMWISRETVTWISLSTQR